MYQNPQRKAEAVRAAEHIRSSLNVLRPGLFDNIRTGLVLGTGWGDALTLYRSLEISFNEIPGFEALGALEGHRRVLEIGFIEEEFKTAVAVLRGRVHMNEDPCDPAVPRMVRLQIAMLCELGVKQFVLTCAAGSIDPYISVGDLAIMNSFVMFGNEIMPLWGGDFVSPEDVLEPSWIPIAGDAAIMADISPIHMGVAHAYVRGPHFEGRHLDKGNLAKLGAQTVGMSVKPECCVAAIYGARALGIAFITNDAVETHDHETNVARTKAVSDKLGGFLSRVVTTLP